MMSHCEHKFEPDYCYDCHAEEAWELGERLKAVCSQRDRLLAALEAAYQRCRCEVDDDDCQGCMHDMRLIKEVNRGE